MKKKFLIIFTIVTLLLPFSLFAQETVEIKIFSSPTCPHCAQAEIFLNDYIDNSDLNINLEKYYIANNVELVQELYQQYLVPQNLQGLVPIIFIEDDYFVGFDDNTKNQIIATIENFNLEKSDLTKIPFLGQVDIKSFSLPVLAILLGIIDGFNVCSLGALVLILGLVMVLKSRKRIFFFGATFLLTTALAYGLLIFLWHQLFSFIAPYIRSLEVLIGVLALIGGVYLLREFYKAYKTGPVCSSNNLMSRLSPKIEKVFRNKKNLFLLFSVVFLFAIIVTIIEFPCSAFLPVLFTSILVEAQTPLNLSLLYIALYMLMYLLDELIIFIIAVLTLKIKIVSPKFIIFFNLLAALIFIFLGLYYLLGA
jgi:glutaredoxin